MQSELPWNVAGIPPEAREAARASARREGLSVGEWLTRRIMRSLAGADTASESWWALDVKSPTNSPEDRSPAHESADMLAHVSRSETESQDASRRIEEQLRNLGRRLEQTERSQSENSRAMTAAAAEINVASREHAQVFDQLRARMVHLGERVGRIEQHPAADGVRDAIKALHQGLSRLADQIAQTATNSAAQAAQLANTIEAVAGKLAESRNDGQQNARAIEERISALAANLGSIAGKLLEAQNESARQSVALTDRLAAAEKAIERYESAQAAGSDESDKIRNHADTLAQLSCSHDELFRQFTSSEGDRAAGFARFENHLSGLDERINESAADRRLQGVEQALTDMTIRFERSERESAGGVSGTMEDDLRNLSLRMDAADKRHKESIAELGALVKEAAGRLTNSHGGYTAAEPAAPLSPIKPGEVPSFDLPPFTESGLPEPAMSNDTLAGQLETSSSGDVLGITPAFDIVAPVPGDTPEFRAAAARSFMDAARHTARAATSASKERMENGAFFSWVGAPTAPDPGERTSMRPFLLAALGALIIATIAAGLFLSQNAYMPSPAAHANAAPTLKPHPPYLSPEHAGIAQQTAARTPATRAPVASGGISVAGPPVMRSPITVRVRTKSVQARLIPPVQTVSVPARSTAAPRRAVLSPRERLAQLADAGNPKAQELVGLEYVDGDGAPVNEAEGAKWLERAAGKGEAVAAYRLGTLYERGHGVPSDLLKAAQWYAAAAKAGNRKAMHNLAVAYAEGSGVQKDLASAAHWFAHAADLGLPDSQFNLGVLYERGMGVPQSLTDAYKWYAVAAGQGDSESRARIEALASQISAGDKAAAEKAAAEFHPAPEDRTANSPPDAATLVGG